MPMVATQYLFSRGPDHYLREFFIKKLKKLVKKIFILRQFPIF